MQQTFLNSRDCDCHKYEEMLAVSYDKISAGCGWSLFTVICESLERCVPGNIPHQTENSALVSLLQIHLHTAAHCCIHQILQVVRTQMSEKDSN